MYGTYFPFAEEDSHIHCDAEDSKKGLRVGGRLKIYLGMIFLKLMPYLLFPPQRSRGLYPNEVHGC